MRMMAPVPMMPRYVIANQFGIRGNMPNQRYSHSTAEYRITIETNARGIRSKDEIRYEKPKYIKRIVLLGDSFGFGYGVDSDEMFTARMTYYLKNDCSENVEVINLSTSGHGNAEELIALSNEGFKYSPDLVLLAWHYTDLDDNVRSNLYEISDGKLRRKAKTYLPGVREREFLNQFELYRFLAEKSQIYNFIRNWASGNIKKILTKKGLDQKSGNAVIRKNSKKNYKVLLTLALLNEIEQLCQKNHSNFLIMDIPFRKSRTEFISKFPFEKASNEVSFDVVSPIEPFRQAEGKQLYWEKGDGHWTPLGCDIAGKMLAYHINENNLLFVQK